MSYDIDILARSVETLVDAEKSLRHYIAKSRGYRAIGDGFSWEGEHNAKFMLEFMDEEARREDIQARQEEMEDDPEFFEDDPGTYDPERAIGYIQFNYFRETNCYNAIADELDSILSLGEFELSDEQAERLWRDKIDRKEVFGVLDLDIETLRSAFED